MKINKKLKKMKWNFGVVMTFICVEENRLLVGKKIESFLKKKLNIFLDYSKALFNNAINILGYS